MKVTMSSNVTCDSNPDLENIDDRSTACAYKVILYIFFFAIDENEENDRLLFTGIQ